MNAMSACAASVAQGLDPARLWQRVETLSKFTLPGQPWTRRAFSDQHAAARDWLRNEFELAGLQVSVDAAGNLTGRRAGRNPRRKPIITGSHTDTVMQGGRFDGIIGVLAGLEVACALREKSVPMEHPFEVIDFLSEEPSDYGVSCVGSRGLCGSLDDAMLAAEDGNGDTLAAAIRRAGGDPLRLGKELRGPASTAAFVELHIEQGPVLEAKKLPIGVVTHIVGIRRVALLVEGRPDHAGTTPMDLRCDALAGAALIIAEVQQAAAALARHGPDYVVATIGRIVVTPNASNAVPGRAEMTLEVRSDNPDVLSAFPENIIDMVAAELAALRLKLTMTPQTLSHPTRCSPLVMNIIEQASAAQGYASMRMPSGAGHDGVYVAKTGPIGMIFIPCLNGRSHCPEEWIDPGQLLDGTRVLCETIVRLDRSLAAPGA